MFRFAAILTALLFLFVGVAHAAGKFPWRRRIGKNVETLHLTAHRNTPVEIWPEEPASPTPANVENFKKALGEICGKMPNQRLTRYTELILSESKMAGVDPFLLAALMYDQSGCWPTTPKRDSRVGHFGLTRLPFVMHARQMKKGVYTWYTRTDTEWIEKTTVLDRFSYNKWQVTKPEPNLYFAASFLRILKDQESSLDAAFESVPHRHFVSHWFYGDRVRQVEPENRVLTARRRLIAYYNKDTAISAGEHKGCPIISPFDGVPRLVIDYFGNKRGNKNSYGHRGIDIDCAAGEPVRAIASGRVTFTGVDQPGASNHEILTPKEAAKLTNDQMGPGGLYVVLNHGNEFGTFYMHLKSTTVNYQDQVEAGQIIGTCGRSGTKTPGPHLHLEFREGTGRIDPAGPLSNILVNPYK